MVRGKTLDRERRSSIWPRAVFCSAGGCRLSYLLRQIVSAALGDSMTHFWLRELTSGGIGPQHRTGKGIASVLIVLAAAAGIPAHAAKEDGCSGGPFSVVTATGVLVGNQNFTIPSASLGTTFSV